MFDFILLITAFLSVLSAVIAWAAKIWWGKELIKAKDAHIALLEREIRSLKDFTPMKIREYYLSVKDQLEEHIEKLKNENKNLKNKSIEDREHHVTELEKKKEEIEILLGKIESFNRQIEGLKAYVSGSYYESES